MTQTTAARLLRAARAARGLKQGELAARAEVPQSVVSAYERGRREPGVEALERLLHALDFELKLTRRPCAIDRARAAEVLADLLDLADHLPQRDPGRLEFPRFG